MFNSRTVSAMSFTPSLFSAKSYLSENLRLKSIMYGTRTAFAFLKCTSHYTDTPFNMKNTVHIIHRVSVVLITAFWKLPFRINDKAAHHFKCRDGIMCFLVICSILRIPSSGSEHGLNFFKKNVIHT